MRFWVPAVVVLIIVVGGLIAYSMHNRSERKKRELDDYSRRALLAESAIRQIKVEKKLQEDAGYDMFGFQQILKQYDTETDNHIREINAR